MLLVLSFPGLEALLHDHGVDRRELLGLPPVVGSWVGQPTWGFEFDRSSVPPLGFACRPSAGLLSEWFAAGAVRWFGCDPDRESIASAVVADWFGVDPDPVLVAWAVACIGELLLVGVFDQNWRAGNHDEIVTNVHFRATLRDPVILRRLQQDLFGITDEELVMRVVADPQGWRDQDFEFLFLVMATWIYGVHALCCVGQPGVADCELRPKKRWWEVPGRGARLKAKWGKAFLTDLPGPVPVGSAQVMLKREDGSKEQVGLVPDRSVFKRCAELIASAYAVCCLDEIGLLREYGTRQRLFPDGDGSVTMVVGASRFASDFLEDALEDWSPETGVWLSACLESWPDDPPGGMFLSPSNPEFVVWLRSHGCEITPAATRLMTALDGTSGEDPQAVFEEVLTGPLPPIDLVEWGTPVVPDRRRLADTDMTNLKAVFQGGVKAVFRRT